MSTNRLANPIPLLARFYREAKNILNDKDGLTLTAQNWHEIKRIMDNEAHKSFDCRSLANLLLAFERKGGTWKLIKKHNLAEAFVASIIRHLQHAKAREICALLRVLTYIRLNFEEFRALDLDQNFVLAIQKNIYDCNSLDLADMLSAYVTFNLSWQDLINRKLDKLILIALQKNITDLQEKSVSSILWSLAHLGLTLQELDEYQLAKPFLEAVEANYSQMDEVYLRRLKQAQLWFEFELPEIQEDFDAELKKLPKPESSKMHLDISNSMQTLTTMKIVNEKCYGLVLWVDIGFKDCDVVFEVNGPSHEAYLDRFKKTLLEKLGVTVDYINYEDNITVDYLKEKLLKNGIPVIGLENNLLEHTAPHSSPDVSTTQRKAKRNQKNKRKSEFNASLHEITEAKPTLFAKELGKKDTSLLEFDANKSKMAAKSERQIVQKIINKEKSKNNIVPQKHGAKKSPLCTYTIYAASAVASLVAAAGAMNLAVDYIEKKYF